LSLPRFRTLAGVMPKDGEPVSEEALARSRTRAGRQAIHTVGRLIGSFPCKEERCMHHRSSTVDVLDRADEVCEKHQLMIAALLEAGAVPGDRAAATQQAPEAAAASPADAGSGIRAE